MGSFETFSISKESNEECVKTDKFHFLTFTLELRRSSD